LPRNPVVTSCFSLITQGSEAAMWSTGLAKGFESRSLLLSGALGLAAVAYLGSGHGSSLLRRLRRLLGWRCQYRIVSIHIFPVKSMAGLEVSSAELDSFGLVHDRRFAVTDNAGQIITQREKDRMRLLVPSLTDGHLVLHDSERPEAGSVQVPLLDVREGDGQLITAWAKPSLEWGNFSPLCLDCGSEAARWLTQALDGHEAGAEPKYHLVRMAGEAGERYEKKARRLRAASVEQVFADCYSEHDNLVFQDSSPLNIASLASLRKLNRCLKKAGKPPVDVQNFRANLIVDGGEPFEEDWWSRLTLQGSTPESFVALRLAKPTHRCVVTTKRQIIVGPEEQGKSHQAKKGLEPLQSLKTFRLLRDGLDERFKTAPCFAVNISFVSRQDAPGRKVNVGNTLTVDAWASQSVLLANDLQAAIG